MTGHKNSLPAEQKLPLARRIAPALGLFFLAPLTAEYLIGYDSLTGNFTVMLTGLAILAPLYGGPALIIRELARRSGRGWPTMILLAFAFGVFQAGLVDHSLFNPSYRDIDYWQDLLYPTYLPALGIGGYFATTFILGHVIWSIGVPIALVETFVERRTTPWLGRLGLSLTVVLYLFASALVFFGHVTEEQFLPSMPQLFSVGVIVATLSVGAFAIPKRLRLSEDRPVPRAWQAGALAFAALSLPSVIENVLQWLGSPIGIVVGWWNVGLRVVLLTVLTVLVVRWAHRKGWSAAHALALAGGALLTRTWIAFTLEPLGEVSLQDKLLHNTIFAVGVVVLLVMAARALRQKT